jgi:predicted molibdopterin-dependent oxidoreductase YjgC
MVGLTINGQAIDAEEGMTILQAAQRARIHIPTLCSHPLLKPYGACRLCVVEVDGAVGSKIVTSCTYPAEHGLEIKTDSPAVVNIRRTLVELLFARAPRAKVVQRLAREYGVEGTPLHIFDEGELCILCGLCARACEEIVGASAIDFVKRGIQREVTFTPEISSELCVGCGVCTALCPTGCLETEQPYGVISAIEMGRRAAAAIDKYLGGEGKIDEVLVQAERPNPWLERDEGFAHRPRRRIPLLAGTDREQAMANEKCLRCVEISIEKPILPPERCRLQRRISKT